MALTSENTTAAPRHTRESRRQEYEATNVAEQTESENGPSNDQNSRRSIIEIADDEEFRIEPEHPFHVLSTPVRTAMNLSARTIPYSPQIPSGPLSFYRRPSSGRTESESAYKNVSFEFYKADGERVDEAIPFSECSTAVILKDIAIEEKVIHMYD